MEVKGSSESIWWIVVECACRILGVSTATGKIQPLEKLNIKVQLNIIHMYSSSCVGLIYLLGKKVDINSHQHEGFGQVLLL